MVVARFDRLEDTYLQLKPPGNKAMKNHTALDATDGSTSDQQYTDWEREIIECVADDLGISFSEAAGVAEAQPFCLAQSWGAGLSAPQTAEKLIRD
ncbi:hypothetical protein QX25_18275 (plasmid) [Stutzerimonas stutzeri]|nr:hypothetical protein QX25_18275 [Stutzerimonas stutzeri]